MMIAAWIVIAVAVVWFLYWLLTRKRVQALPRGDSRDIRRIEEGPCCVKRHRHEGNQFGFAAELVDSGSPSFISVVIRLRADNTVLKYRSARAAVEDGWMVD
jgi:hypothetical protein